MLFPFDGVPGRDKDIVGEEHHVGAGAGVGYASVHRAHAQFHRATEAVARR